MNSDPVRMITYQSLQNYINAQINTYGPFNPPNTDNIITNNTTNSLDGDNVIPFDESGDVSGTGASCPVSDDGTNGPGTSFIDTIGWDISPTILNANFQPGYYEVHRPKQGAPLMVGPYHHAYILHVLSDGSREAFGITSEGGYLYGDPISLRYTGYNKLYSDLGVDPQPIDLDIDISRVVISPIHNINADVFQERMYLWAAKTITGTYSFGFNDCQNWVHNEITQSGGYVGDSHTPLTW
jgi:hypothetical protein